MERIIFYDKDHSYWYKGKRLVSGTSFVGKFEPEYQREYYLSRGAIKKILGDKEYKRLREKWRSYGRKIMNDDFISYLLEHVDGFDFMEARQALADEWDAKTEKACIKGTAYHLGREKASYARGYELNPFDEKEYVVYQKEPCPEGDNCSLAENLYDLPDGFYPELLVSTIEYQGQYLGLCGQSDKVFLGTDSQGVRYCMVDDFKTNRVLKKFAMKDEDTGKPITMLDPISHMHSHHLTKYGLQLSLYAWFLEQHGFQVRNLGITHINELHPLPYYKKEIEAMVKYFLKNMQK
jgi:hypothetical protein